MEKIPVGATIAQAFNFAFGGFFNLVRLTWLPLVLTLGGSALVMRFLTPLLQGGQADVTGAIPLLLALYPLMLVMAFVMIAAIAQSALGQDTGTGWLYLPLGKPLWRLTGAWLLALLLILVVMVLGGMAMAFVAGLAAAAWGAVVGALAISLFTLIFYGALTYGFVRLTFLITPVVIAEQQIALRRSWSLGKGSFWRMFIILVAVMLPFIFVEMLGFGFLMSGMPTITPGASPAAVQAAILAWEVDLFSRLSTYWYIVFPVFAVFTILFYGALVGAQCFAYRALVPTDTQAEAFS